MIFSVNVQYCVCVVLTDKSIVHISFLVTLKTWQDLIMLRSHRADRMVPLQTPEKLPSSGLPGYVAHWMCTVGSIRSAVLCETILRNTKHAHTEIVQSSDFSELWKSFAKCTKSNNFVFTQEGAWHTVHTTEQDTYGKQHLYRVVFMWEFVCFY